MGNDLSSELPSRLQQAVEDGELIGFCGAGVSMAPPSNVPGWGQFNEILLSRLKAEANSALPELPEETAEAIDSLSIDDVGYRDFSDAIVRTFAGDSYFPVVSVLDDTEPNDNHWALAELARRGALRAIVTTNFDTLIETAFRRAGVPLDVVVTEEDLRRTDLGSKGCVLYKIHGTVDESSTLVDTATQKLRGLPESIRAHLMSLYETNHVFVVGYSGGDLAFDTDYLGFDVIDGTTPGISWLVRPNSDTPPEVASVVRRAGETGEVVRGSLPDVLTDIAGELPDPRAPGDDEQLPESEQRVRDEVSEWLELPHIEPLVCAGFCSHLLRKTGYRSAAQTIERAIVERDELQGEKMPLTLLPAVSVVATGAAQDGRLDDAEKWINREIVGTRHALEKLPDDAKKEAVRELQYDLAGAYINRANVKRQRGNVGDGLDDLQTARKLAIRADQPDRRAQVELQKGLFGIEMGKKDQSLGCLRTAHRLAEHAGQAKVMFEATTKEAKILLELGEYAVAEQRLERARRYEAAYDYFDKQSYRRTLEAELVARRGDLSTAQRQLEAIAKEAAEQNADGLAQVAHLQRVKLGFRDAAEKEEVLDALDRIEELRSQETERLVHVDDTIPVSLPSPDEIDALREEIESMDSMPPFFFDQEYEGEPEWMADVRFSLIIHQFRGNHSQAAVLFQHLCHALLGTPRPRRLADLARCYRDAAADANEPEMRSEALLYTGIARDERGEIRDALDAFRRAKELADSEDSTLQARIDCRMAATAAKQIPPEHRPELFIQSIDRLASDDERAEECRARGAYAKYLSRTGDREEALEQAETALEAADEVSDNESEEIEKLVKFLRRTVEDVGDDTDADQLPLSLEPTTGGDNTVDDFDNVDLESLSTEEIADAGVAAVEAGEHEQGRDLILTALEQYQNADDRLGISRCLNNLADFWSRKEEWERAATLRERALALRRELTDRRGELLTLSNLAANYFNLGAYERALDLCEDVETIQTRKESLHAEVTTQYVKALTLSELGRTREAVEAYQEFVTGAESLDDPEVRDLADRVREMLTSDDVEDSLGEDPSDTAAVSESDEFENRLAEATRLVNIGQNESALELLETVSIEELSDLQVGQLEATCGNALQNEDRHEEAIDAYRRSVESFEEAGQTPMEVRARCYQSVSLRELGRYEEAERLLRPMLERLDPGSEKAQVQATLANVIRKRTTENEDEDYETGRRTAEKLFEDALENPDLRQQQIGGILVNIAAIHRERGEMDEALERARTALDHFKRVNSSRVSECEALIESFEEERDSN